ncbi:helix-turn-helix domain-containing protein [Asaia lannensis]|uniref:Helix-turn-helix domain-containing protein n=1 Tax=Asaia lannensis NBRC 102526 TaxID=1307926 RepID=A0ABT1CDF8_9PROT|nr:helix-turn-helix domain-containing protein [Asaia lannensis]MCO6158895.1 helix-turn-helix domain-containing protein [Asaia lannensis NBRC 102526]GBQ99950.1 AraC family transcriptional regulator [Asaia lannensis NBRC 102526]
MPLVLQSYDTAGLSPRAGAELWHDIVCQAFVPLECKPQDPEFRGAITRIGLDTSSIASVSARAQSVSRTRRLISTAASHHFLLSFGVSGRGQVIQDGREAIMQRGTFALYHTGRPYTLRFDRNFEQIVFMMPDAALATRFGHADSLTATPIGDGNPLAALTGRFLEGLMGMTRPLSDMLVSRLATQAAELVASMLIATGHRSGAATSHRLAMGLQIRNAIELRLRDPEFGRRSLATQFRISTRYLDDIFADEGMGVAEYIMKRRLEWAREALSDPGRDRYQIGEIARMSGFVSQAHFSRVFAAAYRCTPRDWRNACRAAPMHPAL